MLKVLLVIFVLFSFFTYSEETIQSLDERLTDLELKSLVQNLKFGLDVKTMGGRAYATNIPSGEKTSNNAYYAGLVRLNISGKVSDQLRFYSSFQTFRFFNSGIMGSDQTARETDQITGDNMRLFAGYFDYDLFGKYASFSAGRLPTTQGPPLHLREGKDRTGTYPVTGYSLPLDGMALTVNVHEFVKMPFDLIFRSIASPGTMTDTSYFWRGSPTGSSANPYQKIGQSSFYTQMLEFDHKASPSFKGWERALLIFQYSNATFGAPSPTTTVGLQPGDESTYKIAANQKYGFKTTILTGYLELNKFLKSNNDFYLSYTLTKIHNPAEMKATVLSSVSGYPAGTVVNIGTFLLPNHSSGHRLITGLRREFVENHFFGAEYMYAAKDTMPTIFYTDNMFNPYFDNGTTYQLYYMRKLMGGRAFASVNYLNSLKTQDIASQFQYVAARDRVQAAYLVFGFKI